METSLQQKVGHNSKMASNDDLSNGKRPNTYFHERLTNTHVRGFETSSKKKRARATAAKNFSEGTAHPRAPRDSISRKANPSLRLMARVTRLKDSTRPSVLWLSARRSACSLFASSTHPSAAAGPCIRFSPLSS